MKRWIFNILTALSLAIWLVIVALWIRSHWVEDRLECQDRSENIYSIATLTGEFIFSVDHFESLDWPMGLDFDWSHNPTDQRDYLPESTGIVGVSVDRTPFFLPAGTLYGLPISPVGWHIVISLWLPTLILSLLPILWIRLWRKQRRVARRKAQGLCLACGYDLRASSNHCPECGAAIPAGTGKPPLSSGIP